MMYQLIGIILPLLYMLFIIYLRLDDKCNLNHKMVAFSSYYLSFHYREIIYKCKKCGKKEIREVYRDFGDPFPIETGLFMNKEEFDQLKKASA